MDVGIIILGLVVVFAVVVFLKTSSGESDFADPKKVLDEVEVYLAYGKTEEAKELLKKAIVASPSNAELLRSKLNSL